MNQCIHTLKCEIFSGSEHALAQLYNQLHRKLFKFSKTIVHSNELAEEVVDDVFIKLWRNRHNLSEINNLTVYLYTATKNTSLNSIAAKATELVTAPFDSLDFDALGHTVDPYDLMITNEMMGRMRKAIDELPPRCKMIFKLVREDGLKYKEVSCILNISVNTIDAQMAIAVRKIAEALHIQRPVKAQGMAKKV